MKKILFFLFFFFIVSLTAFMSLFFYYTNFREEGSFTSPLPQFLSIIENKQVTLLDFWLPFFDTSHVEESAPKSDARSALMYDLTNDNVLYEKNARERMPMASLTKIMTAIIALENPRYDNRYLVHNYDLVGEDSMGLVAGEVVNLEELLYGLMLPSGNDAAEVLASNFIPVEAGLPAGRQAFLNTMNDKAKALGLTDTAFSNPSGLQGDGIQHTSAHDLLVITKYALEKFPLLRKIVSTYEYEIPATLTHGYYHLYNATNLISTYPGVKGVKTGYTPEAGMCLVTYYEDNGVQMIGILLNSPNRRQEMKDLLDYSLKSLNITPPPHE